MITIRMNKTGINTSPGKVIKHLNAEIIEDTGEKIVAGDFNFI